MDAVDMDIIGSISRKAEGIFFQSKLFIQMTRMMSP